MENSVLTCDFPKIVHTRSTSVNAYSQESTPGLPTSAKATEYTYIVISPNTQFHFNPHIQKA